MKLKLTNTNKLIKIKNNYESSEIIDEGITTEDYLKMKKEELTDSEINILQYEEKTLDDILQSGIISEVFSIQCKQMLEIKNTVVDFLIEEGK